MRRRRAVAQERLEEVVVEGYRANDPGTVTKLPTPISDTPMSVQIISRQVIEDQAALRMEDVYVNASGVVESGNTPTPSRKFCLSSAASSLQ